MSNYQAKQVHTTNKFTLSIGGTRSFSKPHKYVLGYSAGVGHWFELFAGDHSPAVRVHRANRGLLVEGSFQDLLIAKAAQLKAALKITSDTLLAHRMSARRILFKTFSEWDVRKLKAAL